MNIEKLPIFAGVDIGRIEDPLRPVLSINWQADQAHRTRGHQHPRAQIIYQLSGTYRVTTDSGNFIVPPQQAIWIPPNRYHETYTSDAAQALMLFIDFSLAQSLPQHCMVVAVSPLLAQLFIRAANYGNDYSSEGKEFRLVSVMLDELHSLQPQHMTLPLAKDKRLHKAMENLLRHPTRELSLQQLANQCAASSRTLARLFRQQVGMTYLEWRNRLCLLEAIDRLTQGQAVSRVAGDLGYQSVSAFIAMFRRHMGVSPSRYISEHFNSAAARTPTRRRVVEGVS